MNHPRITADVVDHIERIIDALREAQTDGEVTTANLVAIEGQLAEVYRLTMHVDQSVKHVVTELRTGTYSPSSRRQLAEIRAERERTQPRLRVIRGGRPNELEAG